MIQQAGDVARNVSMQLRHRTQAAGRLGGFLMGREILAMVLNHFRTPGVTETMFTMEHIVKMTYYGDAHLDQFYDKWTEMVNNMRPEDVPPEDWLRHALYKKIRHSNLLMYDIKQYESWDEGDERKNYRYLRNVIERTIARIKEDKHAAARDKYAREYAGTVKPGTPAPATPTPKAGNENAPDAKAKAKPKAKAKVEAAPVLPSPSPKNHAKGKGKGKGNGTPRKPGASQSPSPKDKKKIPCHFHFVKKACKKGKDCEYSHDQKVFDNQKKKKDGKNSRSQSPRSKSPANKPKKIDEPCWNWAKGSCKFGDKCRRRHDQHLFNTAPSTPKSSAAPALLHGFDSDDDDDDSHTAKVASSISKMKVNFNMKNVESITYEKDDFIECERRGPRNKNRQRSSKTTEEIRKDEQWTFDCRIARSRGKAMAILMNEGDEYDGIDEVHIVIGPQYDIRIKMVEDGYGDLANEIFEENYIEHVPGKFGIKGNVMCITVPVEERDKKFIMDSGSGHDLIARRKVDRLDNETYEGEMVNFHTANGVTSTSQMTDLNFEVFDEPVKAHVLDDTPSVLSMGKRCMEQGFSFVWPSGKDPFMIDNDGYVVKMKVKDHIPYINIDQCKEIGNKSKIQKLMNVLDDDCSTSDGENILVIDGESGDEMIERPTSQGPKKVNKTKKRRKKKKAHEVAVGWEEDYEGHVEELDDVDDDEDVYPPSIAGDAPDVEHGVEVDDAEAGEDDDEDVIDVDEEDGGPRLSKRGTLKIK
eukprot:s934_g6.t1